jgi:hypothetical protein
MASGPSLDGVDADSSTAKLPPRGVYVTRRSLPSRLNRYRFRFYEWVFAGENGI